MLLECSRNRGKDGTYLCFLPRKEEERVRPWEVYKLDLHTPPSMRQADLVVAADSAVFAAQQYLQIMTDKMGECSVPSRELWECVCIIPSLLQALYTVQVTARSLSLSLHHHD